MIAEKSRAKHKKGKKKDLKRCHICHRLGKRSKMYRCDEDAEGRLTLKTQWLHRRCMVRWNQLAEVFQEEWGEP